MPKPNDARNRVLTNTKSFAECGLRNRPAIVERPYFQDFLGGQFGRVDAFTARPVCSILAKHVSHIVGPRSDKQVRRPNAARIVALMAHLQTSRYRVLSQLVGDSMRLLPPILKSRHAVAAHEAFLPNPASCRVTVDALPKSLLGHPGSFAGRMSPPRSMRRWQPCTI